MSATDRENRLLVAEDWTKVYQSFRNADFQSYDFENIRRTMVNYIRQNYPEDFNDYIESSEYLALIDLIAFLGQNIAFRVDLNARENFLELAERRDSILRLARVISYNAKRNIAAQGLLKFTTISTTETVIDSNGRNLANQVISWNDPSNSNWNDQFIKVLNAALPVSQQFGNPTDSATIYGIPTSQYRFNAANNDVPVYGFTKVVSGMSMNFEITSTAFKGQNFIYEEAPKLGNSIACIYRDDGQGAGSANSGFFFNFTQGSLNTGTFAITQPSTNESIDITSQNINNNDVWLYGLDVNGLESNAWTKVPSLTGTNIVYNSVNNNIRNIYGVVTRASDAISLTFADGTFGNLPQGTFRVYYRVSNGISYVINPQDIRNVSIELPYISATGQNHTLSISLSLTSSVTNSTPAESNESIKTNAPQTYYTQNRMITGEDYNISPLSASQQVLKVKAINRTSSGISRYFDLVDPSSKYSSTVLYSDDGVIYNEVYSNSINFSYISKTDVEYVIYNTVFDILSYDNLRNFYYSKFIRDAVTDGFSATFVQTETDITTSYGTLTVSSNAAFDLIYIKVGAMVKFIAPYGYYFDTNNYNSLVEGTAVLPGSSYYLWAEVISVNNGVYQFNTILPSLSVISKIIPKWSSSIDEKTTISNIIDLVFSNQPFGLRYDVTTSAWQIVYNSNLNSISSFSLEFQGDLTNNHRDASWLLNFIPNNGSYTIVSRETRYIFESDKAIRFYFDGNNKIYNSETATIVNDLITVLSINVNTSATTVNAIGLIGKPTLTVTNALGITVGMLVTGVGIGQGAIVNKVEQLTNGYITITLSIVNSAAVNGPISFTQLGSPSYTNDITWKISSSYIGQDGYIDTKKVVVAFVDNNNSTVYDPDLFQKLVPPSTSNNKYIFQQKYLITNGQEDYRYVSNSDNKVIILASQSAVDSLSAYANGQYFYFIDTGVVKKLVLPYGLVTSLDYKVYIGRDNIKFKYTHAADYDSRIDPGVSNIIDIFVLTNDYDITFRQWINGTITTKPLPPSSDELYNTLSPSLNLIKTVSDEIIYHPVSYTVLFGRTAIPELQATFKVIKNPEQVVTDNDVKSRVITAINQFFSIQNWNFGDTFYFTELSTYVISQLAPDIVSFVIVPNKSDLNFGSLFEITANTDQLFINGATVDDIEIISGITSSNIKSGSSISATASTSQQSVTSSPYGSL
jgi:hypothetical protein